MATLNLYYMVCNDTQEWPRDELYMKVGDREVWSKGTGTFSSGVGVGDTPGIYKSIPIGDAAAVRLYEDDSWPNGDERLGVLNVSASQAGTGLQQASFTENSSNYLLYYEVVA